MSRWAIDLGTTNTSIARWHDREAHPELIHLPRICRQAGPDQKLEVRYSVPSSVWLLPHEDWKTRVGRWSWVQQLAFIGQQARIGREALEADGGLMRPHLVQRFKRALMKDALQPVAQVGGQRYTAVSVARTFLRELLAETTAVTGERPRDVVFSTPVDSFDPYRAWLTRIADSVGITRLRTIDEPVAAALGYGLRIEGSRHVLVIDFGGGTLDLALIRLSEDAATTGRCEVVAKEGLQIGGDLVDAWLVEAYCERQGFDLREDADDPNRSWWYRIMLEEARRVKESLFFRPEETFFFHPPAELQRIPRSLRSRGNLVPECTFRRTDLTQLLEARGLYRELDACIQRVLQQARAKGVEEQLISDILMVGGSTLLPDLYPQVERRFGRDRVRAWQPLEAVAFGACCYSAGHFVRSDFITHDYAFLTHRRQGQEVLKEHQVIIRAGTSFPTSEAVWRGQLTPTCSLGAPEGLFKLVICELSQRRSRFQELAWDAQGLLHTLGDASDSSPVVVPLNEQNPALGTLTPPHMPGDTQARLEVSFGINSDRWLWATVVDLKTQKTLMQEKPVVRIQ